MERIMPRNKPAASRTGQFIRRSLLGGLVVLLPVAIIGFFFKWLYQTVTRMIAPGTELLVTGFNMPRFAADWIVVAVLILFCFMVGHLVTTRFGGWMWSRLETGLARLPGYQTVKEIISQLVGSDSDANMKRGEVARVWLYGREVDVSVTALVTARHADGRVTVFVPTGPNPTTGFIYHLSADLVETFPEVRVEQMMKTVVACGAGSAQLFHKQQLKD
jgi:uncharacterized membrane protein